MKKIYCAAAAFLLIFTFQSCSSGNNSETPDSQVTSVFTTPTEISSVSETFSQTPVSGTSAPASSSLISTSESESVLTETAETADYDSAELSMLEIAGNPDYSAEAAIPYVAWTEINLDKTMYAVSRCFGYEFALPDASEKMIYDAGIALNVIARTSTGYYRIEENYYIPCSSLDNYPPEGADPSAATSCTVPPPPVTTNVFAATTK